MREASRGSTYGCYVVQFLQPAVISRKSEITVGRRVGFRWFCVNAYLGCASITSSLFADLFRRLSPWTAASFQRGPSVGSEERALQSGLSTALRISFKFVALKKKRSWS